MKQIRRSVFETNSSSTHSISIEREITNSFTFTKQEGDPKLLDILKYPIVQSDYTYDATMKLRIVVALISEYIADEYIEVKKEEYKKKNNISSSDYRSLSSMNYYDYLSKVRNSKGSQTYILKHKFWRYLNKFLLKEYNFQIPIYPVKPYFPYVSDFIDVGLGAETRAYYKVLNLSKSMTVNEFYKYVCPIIVDANLGFYQETYFDR